MSGNHRSGRLRLPNELHDARGTSRPCRHGDSEAPLAIGAPQKPDGLPAEAAWLWDEIEAAYRGKGVTARLDTAALWAACELWCLYRAAVSVALDDPVDKVARSAVTGYWSAFERIAARFGLTPCDRARLRDLAPPPATTPAGKERFFKTVG